MLRIAIFCLIALFVLACSREPDYNVTAPLSAASARYKAEQIARMCGWTCIEVGDDSNSMQEISIHGILLIANDYEGSVIGDVILYRRGDGKIVAHSMVDKSGNLFLTMGTNNRRADQWEPSESYIGTVVGQIYHRKPQ